MKGTLRPGFAKRLKKKVESFQFEVGVIEDKPHFQAVDTPVVGPAQPLKTYAGGPARKQTRTPSGLTTGQVLVENMKRLGVDLLRAPFLKNNNADIQKFTKAFLRTAFAKDSPKRVENLLQAVVRNPILRQDYGPNRSGTADGKGFNRHLIDTAQMFKAIKARVSRRG